MTTIWAKITGPIQGTCGPGPHTRGYPWTRMVPEPLPSCAFARQELEDTLGSRLVDVTTNADKEPRFLLCNAAYELNGRENVPMGTIVCLFKHVIRRGDVWLFQMASFEFGTDSPPTPEPDPHTRGETWRERPGLL